MGRPLRGTTGGCGALCSASHRIRSRPRFPAQLKSWQFPLSADCVRRQLFLRIDDNYFSRSTTITPCPAGGAKRRCQTSLEMSPLAPSRRPRGFIHKIGFFLAAAGGRGGGKVGILVLDFHFSTAHNSRFFACLLFCLRHVTPAISTALPPSGFSWWRRPPPHSPSAWLSAC